MTETTKGTERELPAGWRSAEIGDVCQVNPRRPVLGQRPEAATSFVPMAAVDAVHGRVAGMQKRPFGEVEKGYTYFEEGDVLFAKITPCMQNGKHAVARGLVGGFGFGTTEFHVLRPGEDVVSEWLHAFLRQPVVLTQAIEHFSGSVGQQRLPPEYLAGLELPLPPLPEQKRIAEVLGEGMVAIGKARKAAEERLEAVEALPAAFLREVFPGDGESLREGWKWAELGNLCEGKGQYGTSLRSNGEGRGIPVLGMYHIHRGGIRWENVSSVEMDAEERTKYLLQPGDMLFNRTNSAELVGKTAVYDLAREAVFASYLIRFKLREGIASPDVVSAYVNSRYGRAFIEKNMTRAVGQVNISATTMRGMPIPLPPFAEQTRIAASLKRRTASVDSARTAAEAELETINALPAALLRQAFNGEL